MLAVGNPRFDRDKFPTLQNLPDAEGEANGSASLYAKSIVLNGPNASEYQVKAALSDCDIVHFAVHCLVDEKSPWLAALVLANQIPREDKQASRSNIDDARDDGLLYLNEVYGISLPRTRLVVLSACQSGLGQYYRGEGIVSLVRPFLALRVPMVVASLWSIDSQATSALMIELHRNRTANGMEAGDALRSAQITMAESDLYRNPYYWAPFIAVGSN